ncbi:PREDICTED: molybdate-anion transporter-like [Lupinus angustifolius]|uniref:molybdate-anion transporter-like n=1 Tax=Lupinus angustifolius TaxID=3871 RepID=UPI00092E313C|nr:PREDICTED: molybdate-anion transporter-like [Lupinus angustifolius]
MGVVTEFSIWEPNPSPYIFLFLCCCFSIIFSPNSNLNRTSTIFDHGTSSSFFRFQWNFLLLYSLASVMEGLWSVFGEYELASYGIGRETMVMTLCYGYGTALFAAPVLGVLSDLIGHKKVCLFFCILHFIIALWKRVLDQPSIFMTSICLSLANTIFSFSFETWMVTQHEKHGHRLDSLNDTFWLMTFFESACFIASQIFANWLVGNNTEKNTAPSSAIIFLATICFTFVTKGWAETPGTSSLKEYILSFYEYIFGDKRIWLLAWAQTCLHFSIGIFWILWAPTVVADGREVQLGLIYPCFLGSRMLGSTAFPCLTSGPSSFRTEDCLVYAYIILALLLSIVAYDYQEIGVLVTLFCLFHACVGFIIPSLARLRTMYVPNELRGGMMGLSLAPANAAVLLSVVQGGYYRNVSNATLMAFAVLGLLLAAGCMHSLKKWGKQPYHNWHKQ